jgi:manganese oxidase
MRKLPAAAFIACICLTIVAAAPGSAADPAPAPQPILANDNTVPAGSLVRGRLTLRLEAREGMWRPQADDGGGVIVQAFAEAGGPLRNPGPLIRARAGTLVDVQVRNRLADTLVVYGLHTRPGTGRESLRVAPGAVGRVTFSAGEAGTYYYWGTTTGATMEARTGSDSQLHGAFIIDPAGGPVPADRIFVLGLWFQPGDSTGAEPHGDREIMTINGKSWPHTERLHMTVGDTVRWRWLNPTSSSHPMHLHGFYFRVDSRGGWAVDTVYAPARQRMVVTELMLPGGTMDTRWSPEREGNWLFHCHFAFHMSDELYLAPRGGEDGSHVHGAHGNQHEPGDAARPAAAGMHHGMAGLVLGIQVAANPAYAYTSEITGRARGMRLLVQQSADTSRARHHLGYVLHDVGAEPAPDSIQVPGPLLVLQRGQPVAITVVNRLTQPTAVHWHGIELESFPDGVPGWSGTPGRIMPPIAPADSFVAEFVPPRAGTFIYHSHFGELEQILGGLFGPLIVLEPGERYDPEHDHIFTIGLAGAGFPGAAQQGTVNGTTRLPDLELVAGRSYRFRFINIGDFRTIIALVGDDGFPAARPIAKDGADLPAQQATTGILNLLTAPGETADYAVVLEPGNYRLEFKTQLPGWIVPVRVFVRP